MDAAVAVLVFFISIYLLLLLKIWIDKRRGK